MVAIKWMNLEQQKHLVINDIRVMRISHHPNIVNFIASYLHENALWVAMEYMEGGSLAELLTAPNLMTESQIAAVLKQTAQGLEYLHGSARVIHRDIKSHNVLLNKAGDIKLSESELGLCLVSTKVSKQPISGIARGFRILQLRTEDHWWARHHGWLPRSSRAKNMGAKLTSGAWVLWPLVTDPDPDFSPRFFTLPYRDD